LALARPLEYCRQPYQAAADIKTTTRTQTPHLFSNSIIITPSLTARHVVIYLNMQYSCRRQFVCPKKYFLAIALGFLPEKKENCLFSNSWCSKTASPQAV
jgi:hypothetical protein